MSTQMIVALAVGGFVLVAICCLILIVMVRLQRVIKSQFDTINTLLSTLRTGRAPDAGREPGGE